MEHEHTSGSLLLAFSAAERRAMGAARQEARRRGLTAVETADIDPSVSDGPGGRMLRVSGPSAAVDEFARWYYTSRE